MATRRTRRSRPRPPKFKKCPFCVKQTQPDYLAVDNLKQFITQQGKIMPRSMTGVCAKHQRRLSQAIKRARILALLPFTQPKIVR